MELSSLRPRRGWRDGRPQILLGPIAAPVSGPSGTSVWESRDPAVMTQMPLDVKLAYGDIYDQFASNEVQRLDERMTWLALAEFDGVQRLDDASLMRLQGLLTRARWRAGNISRNLQYALDVADRMGIEPAAPEREENPAAAALCRPVLPKLWPLPAKQNGPRGAVCFACCGSGGPLKVQAIPFMQPVRSNARSDGSQARTVPAGPLRTWPSRRRTRRCRRD